MHLTSRLLTLLDRFSSPMTVHAHCDCRAASMTRAGPDRSRLGQRVYGEVQRLGRRGLQGPAISIKEERAELVKHHLWVLWTDYFKPTISRNTRASQPVLDATKTAGEAKKTTDVAVGERLLEQIAEIDRIFWETKKAESRRQVPASPLVAHRPTPAAAPRPRRRRRPAARGSRARHSARSR